MSQAQDQHSVATIEYAKFYLQKRVNLFHRGKQPAVGIQAWLQLGILGPLNEKWRMLTTLKGLIYPEYFLYIM